MANWLPAASIAGLLPGQEGDLAYLAQAEPESTGVQIRPWVRLWARMIDYLLFSFCLGFFFGIVYPPALEMPNWLFGSLALLGESLVEPCLFAAFGTTPGKALLRVRVRRPGGGKLSFGDALGRSLRVWLCGMGLGLPLVSLFTQLAAYNRLTSDGLTSWDGKGGFVVSHRIIGVWRTLLAILFFAGVVALISMG